MNNRNSWAVTVNALYDAIAPADLIIGTGDDCVRFAQTEMGEFFQASGEADEFTPAKAIAMLSDLYDRFLENDGEWNRTNPERHIGVTPTLSGYEIEAVCEAVDPDDGDYGSLAEMYMTDEAKKELSQAWMMLTLALKQYGVNPLEELEKWANAKAKKRGARRG